MMIAIAKYITILFGIFLIYVGFMMLLTPKKTRQILRKAGSTNFINYAEITIRMLPAAGLILYASLSKFPEVFKIVGWFMLATSLVLYFIPRRLHHGYALKSAEILKPLYFQCISPLSFLFGSFLIYAVL